MDCLSNGKNTKSIFNYIRWGHESRTFFFYLWELNLQIRKKGDKSL